MRNGEKGNIPGVLFLGLPTLSWCIYRWKN
jgi:hypothetical protein